jgi:hypothetical protein
MVFTPQTPGLTLFPEVFAWVQAAGGVAVARQEAQGLEIVLYAPAGRPTGRPCLSHRRRTSEQAITAGLRPGSLFLRNYSLSYIFTFFENLLAQPYRPLYTTN